MNSAETATAEECSCPLLRKSIKIRFLFLEILRKNCGFNTRGQRLSPRSKWYGMPHIFIHFVFSVRLLAINIDGKDEYPGGPTHALYLVRSTGCSALWAPQTQRNHHGRSISTTIDAFVQSIEGKTVAILQHDNARSYAAKPVKTYLETHKWEKSYPTRRIHSTLLLPIITFPDRWLMAWLSSTSILIKMPKNGSIRGYPHKTTHSFDMVFVCSQKDRWK